MDTHDQETPKFLSLVREIQDLTAPSHYTETLMDALNGEAEPSERTEAEKALTGLLRWATHEALARAIRAVVQQGQAQEADLREEAAEAERWRKTAHLYRNCLQEIANGTANPEAVAQAALEEGAQLGNPTLIPKEPADRPPGP